RVRDHLAIFLHDVMANALHTDFFFGHPSSLADPVAWQLHFVSGRLPRAPMRPAHARIERPTAGLPAAPGHHRTGAELLLDFPFPPYGVADGVAELAIVLFIDRPIGAITDRHLVFLPYRLADRIPALAIVLFINRPIGAIADRHLVLLPHRLVGRVLALPIV